MWFAYEKRNNNVRLVEWRAANGIPCVAIRVAEGNQWQLMPVRKRRTTPHQRSTNNNKNYQFNLNAATYELWCDKIECDSCWLWRISGVIYCLCVVCTGFLYATNPMASAKSSVDAIFRGKMHGFKPIELTFMVNLWWNGIDYIHTHTLQAVNRATRISMAVLPTFSMRILFAFVENHIWNKYDVGV